ncbi:MAG: phosphate ABC transporter ATP-binding protein [Nitrospinaceae bacterium]|nr:MAG: phosphate ABC transporter ATP-binding protein [Nitrospinaceae bacterium]
MIPAIGIVDVRVAYNGKPVLDAVSARVRKHSAVAVIGPSGTGKSTLLRTLSRMNDRVPGFKVEGKLRVGGEDVYAKGLDVCRLRRKVGMIFQTPCMFPKSIFENVIFGLRHQEPARSKEFPDIAQQVLRRVFLWEEVKDRLHKPAPNLSLGQQQRLAIARTLAVEPDILLLDEPTSSLDPQSALAIEELILSLKKDHTLLLVTHQLAQARRVSDETIFLEAGRVIESGPTEAVFGRPAHAATRAYLGRAEEA